MVVKDFQPFVENEIPGAFRRDNLREIIKREADGVSNPTVVLDASAVIASIKDASGLEYIGQIKDIANGVKKLVDNIMSCGVHLIVVLRGNEGQIDRWYRKETMKKQMMAEGLKILAKDKETKPTFNGIWFGLRNSCVRNTLATISRENYKVLMSLKNNYEEVAGIAKKYNCLVVIGKDSHYLIYEHIKIVVSSTEIDEDTLDCYVYDKNKILDYLGLKSHQLPVFATLCGNENVPGMKKKNVCTQSEETSNQFLGIADYVRNLDDINDINKCSLQLSKKLHVHKTRLMISINTYLNPITSMASQNELSLADHMKLNCRIGVTLHRLLEKKELTFSFFEGDSNIESTAKLMRHLRAKIYGILLYENHPQYIEEYFLDEINKKRGIKQLLFIPFTVYSVKPKGEHPGLRSLWTENSPSINEIKWNLFCEAVSKSLTYSMIMNVPKKLIIPVIALHYLATEIPNMTPYKVFNARYEVEAFLVTALKIYANVISLKKGKYVKPTVRSLCLAIKVNHCCHAIQLLNEACGVVITNEDSCHCNFFDGPLFYYIHKKMEEGTKWNGFFEGDLTLEALFTTLIEIILDKERSQFK